MTPVTTKDAAAIAGFGYEGFRTLLKRGLGRNAGALPPFRAPGGSAEVLFAKKWTWKRFERGNVGVFRLVKELMDAGCGFERANYLASDDHRLWGYFSAEPAGADWFLTVGPKSDWYVLYTSADLDKLPVDLRVEPNVIAVINLGALRRHVAAGFHRAQGTLGTSAA